MTDATTLSAETTAAETAVQKYLEWLDNPAALRDEEAIAAASAAVDAATNVMDRLRAVEARRQAEVVDATGLRNAFCAHAFGWAQTNGISASSFQALGVPVQDLRDAGFDLAGAKGGKAKRSGTRTRVSTDAIRAAVPAGEFTIADLEAASGASTATVRKVITQLIDEGAVVDLGPDANHSGRGRAPLKFRKS